MSAVLALGWQAGPADADGGVLVWLAHRPQTLTPAEHHVWSLCLGRPDRAGPTTEDDVVALSGLPDEQVAGLLAALLARGLVLQGPDLPSLAPRVRMVCTAEGWGNTEDRPAVFTLGVGSRPLVHLPRFLYEAVATAHRWRDLRSAAAGLAEVFAVTAPHLPEATDPAVLLDRLMEALPALCSTHAVYLDVAAVRPEGTA